MMPGKFNLQDLDGELQDQGQNQKLHVQGQCQELESWGKGQGHN